MSRPVGFYTKGGKARPITRSTIGRMNYSENLNLLWNSAAKASKSEGSRSWWSSLEPREKQEVLEMIGASETLFNKDWTSLPPQVQIGIDSAFSEVVGE